MRTVLMSLGLLIAAAFSARAGDDGLSALISGNDMRGWEAVGRIDFGTDSFCTGALIEPGLVLTAAHCLYDKSTGQPYETESMSFQAGLRDGRAEATRSIRRVAAHPDYVFSDDPVAEHVRADLALLQLSQPIRNTRVEPFQISTRILRGAEVGVISYARDRAEHPSLQEVCQVLGTEGGVLVMDCAVDFGASGSPVFRNENGVLRLVSVVAAMADLDGERVALGMDLAAPIAEVRAALDGHTGVFETVPGQARVLRSGERSDTGALFVRP